MKVSLYIRQIHSPPTQKRIQMCMSFVSVLCLVESTGLFIYLFIYLFTYLFFTFLVSWQTNKIQ